jgi:hypothetical protein
MLRSTRPVKAFFNPPDCEHEQRYRNSNDPEDPEAVRYDGVTVLGLEIEKCRAED